MKREGKYFDSWWSIALIEGDFPLGKIIIIFKSLIIMQIYILDDISN